MAGSGITQLRGIVDPVWNRILRGIIKFSGITEPQNFIPPIPPPVGGSFILMEDSGYVLMETGDKILLE